MGAPDRIFKQEKRTLLIVTCPDWIVSFPLELQQHFSEILICVPPCGMLEVCQSMCNLHRRNALTSTLQATQGSNPRATVSEAELDSASNCLEILRGVNTCLLSTPSGHPHEDIWGKNMIKAAKQQMRISGDFQHMVYVSMLQSFTFKAGTIADKKNLVEIELIQSGVPYTIVQHAPIMDHVITPEIFTGQANVMRTLSNPDTPMSYISEPDLQCTLGAVLCHKDRVLHATLQLVGTEVPITFVELVQLVSRHLGRDVQLQRYRSLPEPLVQTTTTNDLRATQYIMRGQKYQSMRRDLNRAVPPADLLGWTEQTPPRGRTASQPVVSQPQGMLWSHRSNVTEWPDQTRNLTNDEDKNDKTPAPLTFMRIPTEQKTL